MTRRDSAMAAGIVGILGPMGSLHFARPEFFDPLVPRWMPGKARTVTYVSGAFELACAVLVANRATRRMGALLAMLTFVGVFPANLQAALDSGMKDLEPPFDSAAVAWLRLPFQIPMIWLAWRVFRQQAASVSGGTVTEIHP